MLVVSGAVFTARKFGYFAKIDKDSSNMLTKIRISIIIYISRQFVKKEKRRHDKRYTESKYMEKICRRSP